MKPVAFASIVVRGVALWLLINGLAGLALLFQQWPQVEWARPAQVMSILVGAILPLVIAGLVWANADWLGARVASAVDEQGSVLPGWSPQDLLRLTFAVVGLVTLVDALPQLVWYASAFLSLNWPQRTALGSFSTSDELRSQFWDVSAKANLASTVARAAVGLVLVLKPAHLASFVGRGEETRAAEPEAEE